MIVSLVTSAWIHRSSGRGVGVARIAILSVVVAVVVMVAIAAILVLGPKSPPGGSSVRLTAAGTNLPADSPYLRVFATDWKPIISLDRRQYNACSVDAYTRCRAALAREDQAMARILADLSAVAVPRRVIGYTTDFETALRSVRALQAKLERDLAQHNISKYRADGRHGSAVICVSPIDEQIEATDTSSEATEQGEPIPAPPPFACGAAPTS